MLNTCTHTTILSRITQCSYLAHMTEGLLPREMKCLEITSTATGNKRGHHLLHKPFKVFIFIIFKQSQLFSISALRLFH